MKRYLLIAVMALLTVGITGCQKENSETEEKTEVVIEDIDEEIMSTDNNVIMSTHIVENNDNTINDEVDINNVAISFYKTELTDDIFEKIYGKSYKEECSIRRDELSYLHVNYVDYEGNIQEGELICNVLIADKLLNIFEELFEAQYPINSIRLIDEFDADDEASMEADNTSCFNYRVVSGTNKISKHGSGLAVDINPFYNPYIHTVNGEEKVEPSGAEAYADRNGEFAHKIDSEDLCYRLFTENGFTWGGNWNSVKDYQHFEYGN